MSIEQLLTENTAALNRNSDLLERVIAGQEAAMAKLEGAVAAKPASRSRKPKDEDAGNAGGEGASTASQEPAATPAVEPAPAADAADAADAPTATQDDVRKAAATLKSKLSDDEAGAFMKSLVSHFGTPKLVGDQSTLTPEQLAQAVFFFERKALGLPVDLNAEYDFAGDPGQGAEAQQDDDF